MLLVRVLAFPLVMALASQMALPVTEYICRFTGARMTACCCASSQHHAAAATFERACCCDLRVSAATVDPRVVDAAGIAVTLTFVATVETAPPWTVVTLPLAAVADDVQAFQRPPDRGRPVYILHHRLLI